MQNVLAYFLSVRGRIDRGQWWIRQFLLLGASFAVALSASSLALVWEPIGPVSFVLMMAAFAAYVWGSLALSIKRLRDAGYSPWLLLLLVIPLVKLVVLFLIVFAPPTDEAGQGRSRCMRCGTPTIGAAAVCPDCLAAR